MAEMKFDVNEFFRRLSTKHADNAESISLYLGFDVPFIGVSCMFLEQTLDKLVEKMHREGFEWPR